MVCLVKRMEMVLALDVLMLREEWGSKNPARWPGCKGGQCGLGSSGFLTASTILNASTAEIAPSADFLDK